MRKYNIKGYCNTEPKHQHQNEAEQHIQDVKKLASKVMDRTNASPKSWFFCLLYTTMLLNNTALATLGYHIAHEVMSGDTSDISPLHSYTFNQPVLYHGQEEEPYPGTGEEAGRWYGVAEIWVTL